MVTDSRTVPDEVVAEFMRQEILVSNPLLDYAYNRQDVENMVISTNRSHKDSEEYSISGEESMGAYVPASRYVIELIK